MKTHIGSTSGRVIFQRIEIFLLAILFSGIYPAIPGDAFWEIKDYRHWSERECEKMLTDSPWAKGLLQSGFGYVVRLDSALPIRQALVRQKQITENYERLSLEKRQEFDKKAEEYLSELFPYTIVVHVIQGSNLGKARRGTPTSYPCSYWQMRTTEMLKDTVSLIPSKGDKIPLQQFIVSRDVCEFIFIFPRHNKGRPVVSKENKAISLEFTGPPPAGAFSVKQNQDVERMFVEFKVKKMNFEGELAF